MIINKSLAKVYSDLAVVDSNVDDILVDTAEIGVAGVGLSAIPDMALASVLGSAVGASISADIAAVKSVADLGAVASVVTSAFGVTDGKVDAIAATIGVAGLGLSAIPAPADMALDSTVAKASVLGAAVGATISEDIAAVKAETVLILADTAEIGAAGISLQAVGSPVGVSLGADIAAVKAVVDNSALEATIGSPVDTDISTDIANVQTAVDALAPNTSGENAGNFSYLDAGAEQTVVELTITDRKLIQGAWLDMTNLTKDGVIKCYYKVDGTNYREFSSEVFTVATDSDGVYIDLNMGVSQDFKITYTEDSDEGDDRVIPYAVIWQLIE